MDVVFCQGVKCSYILRRPSSSLNLLSFLNKYPKVATCRRIQYLDKHSESVCYLSNFSVLNNQNVKRLKSGNLVYKLNSFQYNTLSKSDFSTKTPAQDEDLDKPVDRNITLFQRMKQLAKNYWSVLVPVHLVTSVCWVSIIYICVKHGVDIIGILKSLHLSEKYIEMVQKSNAGDWAFTYALYKICTPVRYTVTIGLTTGCVKYLKHIGYLKSVKKTQPETSKFTSKYSSTNKSNITNHKELQSSKT